MSFEAEVLAHLDTINGRLNTIDGSLKDIELKVSGVNGDPHNRGIFGALNGVTTEVEAINERQRRVTDDIVIVKAEQTRQKAWLRGATSAATVSAGGIGVVLAKVFGAL